jgi:hypothetical protein
VLRRDRTHRHRTRWLAAGVLAALGGALVATPPAAAATIPSPRVNLRVLVVTNGDPSSLAIETELDREGIPYTEVDTRTTGRPTISASYLADAPIGRFQAVVLPGQGGGGLAAAEVSALSAYETQYGVRQVDAYDFPTTTMGAVSTGATGGLDGTTATVTAAGLAGPFSYLKSPVPIEDIDPTIDETFGYLAKPDPAIKAGETFTPLLTATKGTTTGSILGVYAHGGREELVVTANFNQYTQWFNIVAEGIVSWATRGINLGFHRNYFAVQVDDIFLPDSRWSATGDCTPGDGCVDPAVSTTDIRMLPADVTHLVSWQNANDLKLDMVFNAGGSDLWKADTGSATDPLLDAYLADKAQFPWISHTYAHPFLGCIQIPATVIGGTWHCATSPTETPPANAAIPSTLGADGIYYASRAFVKQQLQQNITWAVDNKLPNFDPTQLVSGEHSGLRTLPQQPADNPFFGRALGDLGITWTASDASRETDTRVLSATTSTVPRHPMNIFYNAGTYQDEVDEYNWIYTSTTNGGSGICTANPATSTCIAALPAGTNAQAKASFDSYIQPLEVRNALRYVLTNDPRPFYAHQSNLTEDRILFPVLNGILATYNGAYDAAKTPLVHTDLAGEGQALTRMNAWKAAGKAKGFADGYVDASGVHLPSAVRVPLTVPTGSTGAALEAYAGSLSGWVSGGAAVVPPTTAGGYLVPTAPSSVTATATANNGTATVTWTPGVARVAPVTTWTVTAYAGTTVAATVTSTAATPASLVVPLPFGSYTFDVRATNAVGTGPASAATSPATNVTGPPTPPTGVKATAADTTARITWTASTSEPKYPVTRYEVRTNGGTAPLAVVTTADGATTTAAVTGLTAGTTYTFTVVAVNDLGSSGASAPSDPVTPAATPVTPPPAPEPPAGGGGGGGGVPAPPASAAPGAPRLGTVTAGNGKVDLAWTAPREDGGSAITGYVVRVYKAADGTVAGTVKTSDTSAAITGLTNGTGYTVEVAAENVAGVGPASARSAVVTPSRVPGKVTGVTVKRGAASLAVTWKAPGDGGSPITRYRVTVYLGKGVRPLRTVAVPKLATRVKGLKNGTGYSVDVRAVNAIGTGVPSARSAVVIPATTPRRAVLVGTKAGARGGRRTAIVTWRAPSSTGGSAITSYRIRAVRYSTRGRVRSRTTIVIRSGKARSAELRLAAGTYRFTVQAVNALGVGPASRPSRPTAAR